MGFDAQCTGQPYGCAEGDARGEEAGITAGAGETLRGF